MDATKRTLAQQVESQKREIELLKAQLETAARFAATSQVGDALFDAVVRVGEKQGIEKAAKVADSFVTAGMHAVGNVGLDAAPTQGLENMRAVAVEIAAAIRRLK